MSRWTTEQSAARLRNVHERVTAGPIERAEELFAAIGGPTDALWPGDRWPAIQLDHGHHVGSDGGHGAIRYAVTESGPRLLRMQIHPPTPLQGWHAFEIAPVDHALSGAGREGGRVLWRHVLEVERPSRLARAMVVPLHDALLEDLLDTAEARMVGGEPVRRPLALGVRLRRRVMAWIGRRAARR